jgi:ubiquinone/menaquinone biosynthesis C-methylase UbiE
MERRPTHELLDSDCGTATEIAESLLDLRWLNRWFGGLATSQQMMENVVRETRRNSFRLLEVASGEGFVPQLLTSKFERSGIQLDFTLLDRLLTHLPKNGSMAKLVGDAFQLPFPDAAFDLVASSLFLHHLAPEDIVLFVKEALRVCRVAVLVNDLIRHPLHLALAYAGRPLYRSRITRNDAPASVWQAYTVEEMKAFLEGAGCSRVEVRRHYLYRMGLIAWKSPEPAA